MEPAVEGSVGRASGGEGQVGAVLRAEQGSGATVRVQVPPHTFRKLPVLTPSLPKCGSHAQSMGRMFGERQRDRSLGDDAEAVKGLACSQHILWPE